MSTGTVDVVVMSGATAQKRWPEIRELIKHEFVRSRFNDGCDIWRPLESTQEALEEECWSVFRHVVALSAKDAIIGGWFRVPFKKSFNNENCSPGWFLSSAELGASRSLIADAIVTRAHEVMKSGGFTRVVANMGTVAGAKFLQRRHGYIHQPVQHKANTWVKILVDEGGQG